ncbi:meiotic nuclear division protein 1 homolog isoform X3 [Moschus berezovskii]|uniref:meiotic nuclear division protein 1 homolog isoform X3 n=1 Tax=Moschus berezovskii TaxID=68408 RepID=UPI002443DA46|nr:meiotic nuclear division protein 1 homolog isoform X3 [Moschus berezovskii]
MSKKKGLSAEEKRTRMMEIFYETKDVFQLKDMEKIAPKEKGITAMSVKEVLQSLVDDGMVDCERIGTSNYYWAFPSKALHARKRKLEVLDSQLSEGNQKYANLQKSIEKAKIGRRETEERTMLAKELSSLRDQREQLKAEVEKYRECDPQVVEEIRQANQVAKAAANRWTDLDISVILMFSSVQSLSRVRLSATPSITACLTTSNLPRFMDLTFQVPMQYCSLQHRTLLLSPVTSTTEY